VFAASFASLSNAQTSDGRPPANEFLRQIVDNELQAEKNDHSHWMLRLETRKSGKTEVREVVETKDGDLDWLVSVNGKPLPEDQRRERERGLQRLISNPARRVRICLINRCGQLARSASRPETAVSSHCRPLIKLRK
jgi:hypothetical protein